MDSLFNKEEVTLTSFLNEVTNQMHSNNLAGTKAKMKSLVNNAIFLLEENKIGQREFNILISYLRNLKGLCEGIA
ncbi:MAG: hypothetical protein ABIH08_04745 [Candidatus Omnitrophota bacterium]